MSDGGVLSAAPNAAPAGPCVADQSTDIERDQVNLRNFIELLLDDTRPLRNYKEDPQPGEQFTPEQSMKCMTPS